MRRRLLPALPVLLTILCAACAPPGAPSRTQGDQEKDSGAVAAAIQGADLDGIAFHMEETLAFTGGDIPSNQRLQIKSSADGVARGGRARMTYRIQVSPKQTVSYDMVIGNQVLYVKPRNATAWKRTPAASATALYPVLRLQLVREAVLLARTVGAGSLTTIPGGFGHRYRVTPAPDQLEQLQAIPVTGSQETVFLRTASAEIDATLTMQDKLSRLEVHLSGKDPKNGEVQKVDSTADFTSARVGTIQTPSTSTLVGPDQILSQS